MNAIILSIGDELVLGQTIDTNSAWLSQQLAAIGIPVLSHTTVGDDQKAIESAIQHSASQCDLLIISGGIGPTPDDLTRQALASVLNQPLELNEHWLKFLKDFFKKRNREMPEMNQIQAMVPKGAKIMLNSCGTAAGIEAALTFPGNVRPRPPAQQASPEYMERMFGKTEMLMRETMELLSQQSQVFESFPPLDELQGRALGRVLTKMGRISRDQLVEALTFQKSRGGKLGQILIELKYITEADLQFALIAQKGTSPDAVRTCRVFAIPGVPSEMKAMFTRDIVPGIQKKGGGGVILSRTLHTFGLGESAIAETLGTLMDRKRNPTVGTTVANGIVSVRINSKFESRDEAQAQLNDTEAACHTALGDLVFGADEQTLSQVVGELLKAQKKTVTTAESCTGGLLAKFLTDIPGSSSYFTHGFITYSNLAKTQLLAVPPNLIEKNGAVSQPVVEAMAQGAQAAAKSDFALAISGVAGPDGGTDAKPVGTVCIALSTPHSAPSTTSRTFLFPGDRQTIRDRSAKMALTMLRFHLLGKPLPF